uniref:Zinc finger protein 184 n=1 Tax=Culex pipiens TaxID=7175 RepID=A0A8D8IGX4_CULPI
MENPPPTREKPPQLDDFCRICLLRKPLLRPLAVPLSGVMVPEMLYKVTGTMLNMQEQLPRVICERCLVKLELAYSVAEEFRRLEEKLRLFWFKGGVLVDELVAYQRTEESRVKGHAEEVIERLAVGRLDPFDKGTILKQEPEVKQEASEFCIEILSDDSADEQQEPKVGETPSPAESDLEQDDKDNDSDYVPDGMVDRDDVQIDEDDYSDSSHADVPRLGKETTKCPVCSKEFSTTLSLKRHHRRHIIRAKGKFKCTKCDYALASQQELEIHQLSHSNVNKKTFYECRYCQMPFKSQPRLRAHQEIHEQRKDPLPSSSFTGKKKFWSDGNAPANVNHKLEHILAKQRQKQKIECEFCPRTFRNETELAQHLERRHNDQLDEKSDNADNHLKCSKCGRTFDTDYNFGMHMKKHANVESGKFKCVNCDHAFGTNFELQRHMLRYEKKSEWQKACEKMTPPLVIDTGVKPFFKCPVCDNVFVSRSNYFQHAQTHTEAWPKAQKKSNSVVKAKSSGATTVLHCNECDTLFSSQESYEIHLQQGHRDEGVDEGAPGEPTNQESDHPSDLPIIREVTGSYVKKEAPIEECHIAHENLPMDEYEREPPKPEQVDNLGSEYATEFSIEMLSDDPEDEALEQPTSGAESTSKSWKCNICGIVINTTTDASVTRHMLMHENIQNGTYECEVCNKRYGFNPGLQQHRRIVHNLKQQASDDSFECEQCKKYIKKTKYTFHLSCHRNIKLRTIVCEKCDKAFGAKQYLQSHMMTRACEKVSRSQSRNTP